MAILNNSPCLTLNEIIKKLLNNKFMSDCVFTFENDIRVVQAHSFLLRARSLEFDKQFKSDPENHTKLIHISKYSYEPFLEFMRFIYTDECLITNTNVLPMLELALNYRVPKLENLISEYIIERGLPRSCMLKLYQMCVMESYELLQNWAVDLIGPQLGLILKTDSFLETDPDTLEEILKMDYVGTVANPVPELEIFKSLMTWIAHYSSKNNIPVLERRSKFDRLIRAIRFPLMPISELNTTLREHDQLLTKVDFESFFTSTSNEIWNFNNRKLYDCKADIDDSNPPEERKSTDENNPLATLHNDCKTNDEDKRPSTTVFPCGKNLTTDNKGVEDKSNVPQKVSANALFDNPVSVQPNKAETFSHLTSPRRILRPHSKAMELQQKSQFSTKPIQPIPPIPFTFDLNYLNISFPPHKNNSSELTSQGITAFKPDKDLLIIGLWLKANPSALITITVTCNDVEVLKLNVENRSKEVILSFGESIRLAAGIQCKIIVDGEFHPLPPSLISKRRDVIRKDIATYLKDVKLGRGVEEIFFRIPSDN